MAHLISRKAGRRMAAFTVAAVCAWLLAAPMIPHYSAAALAEANMLTAVYVYDGSKVTYREEDAASLDQMFYAFALFRKGHVSGAHWKNIKKFQAFTQKHPEIMPILSVGGWGADGFSQAASTAEGRATFVSDVLALMEKYGFLGVDIDWEYPGSSAAGIESSPEDRENYTLLLQAMRAGLDERTARDGIPRRLCIAISSSPELMAYLECDKIGATVDQVNLMTYDMQQDDVTSHHTALYASREGAMCADTGVRACLAAGIPAERLMLGVAFYGHQWKLRGAEEDPLHQAATPKNALDYTKIARLIAKSPDAVRYDEVAQAAYFYNGSVLISYDSERSIAQKSLYVTQNGLLGLFAWQYGGDATGTLVQAMRPQTIE